VTPRRLEVYVDPHLCEGHGICSELSPELFEISDDDVADVSDEHPREQQWSAIYAAAAACPRQAIVVLAESAP
jgi:ferredoxin